MTQTKEERKAYQKKYTDKNREKINARRRKYNAKNREKLNAVRKKWEEKNRKKVITTRKKYVAKNREKINADMRKWRNAPENREKHRAWTRDWANRTRLERKQKVFSHYSNGSLKCACCGVKGLEFLTVDHIYGRDNLPEDEKDLYGKDLYRWLSLNDFPSGFQILCWNCNFAKHNLGKCPHEK